LPDLIENIVPAKVISMGQIKFSKKANLPTDMVTLFVSFKIDEMGDVSNVKFLGSDGGDVGDDVFLDVEKAVLGWKFKPAYKTPSREPLVSDVQRMDIVLVAI